jgi:hypothetical protein
MSSSDKRKGVVAALIGVAAIPAVIYLAGRGGGNSNRVILGLHADDLERREILGRVQAVVYFNNQEIGRSYVPAQFVVDKGQTYSFELIPDPTEDLAFDRWEDGSVIRRRTETITAETHLHAIFRAASIPPPPPTQTTIAVEAVDQSGNQLEGLYTVLADGNGLELNTGFTPITFDVEVGRQYIINIQNFAQYVFARWADSGSTNPFRNVLATESPITLRAVYNVGTVPPPPGSGPITSLTPTYHHFLPYSTSDEVRVILSYAASGIVGQNIRGIIEVFDPSGVSIGRATHVYVGRDTDNLPLWRNIPPGISSVGIRCWFENEAAQLISPVVDIPSVARGGTSRTFRAAVPSTSLATTRFISGNYVALADGTYQFAAVFTYRAASSMIGRIVRPTLVLRANGQATILQSVRGPEQSLEDEGSMLVKVGTAGIGNPPSLDIEMFIEDSVTRQVISTRSTFDDFDINGIYP